MRDRITCIYIYTRAERIYSTARGSGEIILTRSDTRASADESIKISHRARASRESGNISNIRQDPSSPILTHTLSLFFSRTPPFLVLASYISLSSPLHTRPCPAYICIFALLLSWREKHFLSTAPARISRTRAVNFSSLLPYKRLSFSAPPSVSFGPAVRVPFSRTFYVVFPDMSRGHEYVNLDLGS